MMPCRNQSLGMWFISFSFLSTTLLACSRWSVLPRPTNCCGSHHGADTGLNLQMLLEIVPFSPVMDGVPHSHHRSYVYQLAVCAPVVCKPNPTPSLWVWESRGGFQMKFRTWDSWVRISLTLGCSGFFLETTSIGNYKNRHLGSVFLRGMHLRYSFHQFFYSCSTGLW